MGDAIGDDALQIRIAVFCMVVSLLITALIPAMLPEWDADEPEALADARLAMENYTGETMINDSPFRLTSVRTPYTANSQTYEISEYRWIYGEILDTYTLNGVSYIDEEIVMLDPTQKSDFPLEYGDTSITAVKEKYEGFWGEVRFFWDAYVVGGNGLLGVLWGVDTVQKEENLPMFNFTGYIYHFDPYYRISTQNGTTTVLNSDMASLNIIWYDGVQGSGISGGLVLASDKTNAIIANYAASEIIESVNSGSDFATKYLLDFEGINVYMYIMFDAVTLATGASLQDAWNGGNWTIAFSSPSADGLLDIFNSNSLSSSLGNLLSTYTSIMMFDMPNVPDTWQFVLWIVCVLPMVFALILFISRFLTHMTGAGILGNVFAFLGL